MWPKSACLAFLSNTLRSEKQYLGPYKHEAQFGNLINFTGLSTNCINGSFDIASFDLIAALVVFLLEVSLKTLKVLLN